MEDKNFNNLIKNTLITEQEHIKGINDIEVPSFDETMDKFWRNIEDKNQVIHIHNKRNVLLQIKRTAVACILILIVSFFFSIIHEIPSVNAFKGSIVKTLILVKDRVVTLQSSNSTSEVKVIEPITNGRDNISELDTLQKEVPFKLMIPTYLPDGYSFKNGKWETSSDNSTVIAQEYKNNKGGTFKIIQQHNLGEIHSTQNAKADNSTAKELEICGLDVIITSSANFSIGTWYVDNSKFEILGTLQEKELISIIESIK